MAVTGGTSTALAEPVPLGGKTGSAEDPGQPGGLDAWFTSTGPMGSNPAAELTVTVALPGGGEGGDAALPVAKGIWDYVLPRYPP
jgi:cell division protein FtsI/penicillin-binding protein 2